MSPKIIKITDPYRTPAASSPSRTFGQEMGDIAVLKLDDVVNDAIKKLRSLIEDAAKRGFRHVEFDMDRALFGAISQAVKAWSEQEGVHVRKIGWFRRWWGFHKTWEASW